MAVNHHLRLALDQVSDDDVLRLVFTACHPVLAVEGRIAPTLRLIGGPTPAEIARALLASPPLRHTLLLLFTDGEELGLLGARALAREAPEAPSVVAPTASTEDDTIPYNRDLLGRGLGVTDLVAVDIRTPADARRADHLAALARARGVFFAGGDQTRILAAFADSPALAAVRRVFARTPWLTSATVIGPRPR